MDPDDWIHSQCTIIEYVWMYYFKVFVIGDNSLNRKDYPITF